MSPVLTNLLSARDLDKDQAIAVLDVAAHMAETQAREMKKLPTLRGSTVVNLFFEDSTRTRISFETAAKRLSADVLSFSPRGSSISKGESFKDTVLTLGAMGADAIVIRHSASGAAHLLAHSGWTNARVVNAGDGCHQHPTQALLDAYTIRRHLAGPDPLGQDLDGLRVAIVGDVLHSRVARSNVDLLTRLGAEVTLVAPPTLLPVGVEAWPARHLYSLDEAIDEGRPHALMMLRIQAERMLSPTGGFFPSQDEYLREYGLDAARLARLGPEALVMHPGPMNRGLEITAAAADSARSVVVEQVANGVAVRMAVLYLALTGAEGRST